MRYPAAYAVVAEEEMVYIEGGSYSFTLGDYQVTLDIDVDAIATFCTNAVVNYIRLLGQTALTNALTGIQAARDDGLSTIGAVQYFWKNQNTLGRAATVVFGAFAGYYVYVQAVNLYYAAVSIFNDLKNAYDQTMNPQTTMVTVGGAA